MGLFNLENPFWNFMGKLVDVIVLGVLWFVCSIPVITIGASTTAMYYVTLKLVRDEEGYTVKSFFKSFKQNFKQSTVIWIIIVLVGAFFAADVYVYRSMQQTWAMLLMFVVYALIIVYALVVLYIFPMVAKFDNTTKNMFKLSFLMSIKHLPVSIGMLVLFLIACVGGYLIPPFAGFFIALSAFLNSYALMRIFDKYIPKENPERYEGYKADESESSDSSISADVK